MCGLPSEGGTAEFAGGRFNAETRRSLRKGREKSKRRMPPGLGRRGVRAALGWTGQEACPTGPRCGVSFRFARYERIINVSNRIYRPWHYGQAHVEEPNEGR